MIKGTKELKRLERIADEAQLAFWEAVRAQEAARVDCALTQAQYKHAADEMAIAKVVWLRAKLGKA